MEELQKFIEALGTPAGVAGVLAFCLWRVSRWASPIVESLVSKHSEFVDTTAKLQGSLNDKVDAVHKDLSIHSLTTNTKLDQLKADLSVVRASSKVVSQS